MRAISWGWLALVIWAAVAVLFLTGCSTVPADLTAAKRNVDSYMTYANYKSTGLKVKLDGTLNLKNYKRPAHLKPNEGNCVDYALAYQRQLGGRGIVVGEQRPDVDHAYLWVDGYRLDVQYRYVVEDK